MNRIGGHLPDALRAMLTEYNLSVGSVLRVHDSSTTPPKIKRFIIVGICPDKISVASIFINSRLNTNVFRTQELRNLQLRFRAQGRDYLDHDSVVDCSFIYEKSYEGLKNSLQASPEINIGTISDQDREQIFRKFKGASTISNHIKEKYDINGTNS